ncbi:EF-hand calcium-binding domain-containing protein 7 [Denticeps clupeoides]|uniref:EF-hand calcium-binding domain-containing protein 7 n=1 Tax=Denticeps clupeoides TaxID=299321 RepID=A0AAY4CTK4_9TELE|nr:EF-hand calcium-binding domain-containing protein 7 [Denticeps clupeoides]
MQRAVRADEEAFYTGCRAAYLAVFKSSLANVTSKEQLCLVLQQAGRNPSRKTLDRHWTPRTKRLNFDDFCEILKQEKPAEQGELLRVFRKMDAGGDGYISHGELHKVLTSTGEKMTAEEVNEIFSLADTNKDGRLDYVAFCGLMASTVEQCQTGALEKLQADTNLKRQNFGSRTDGSPKSPDSLVASTLPEPLQKSEPGAAQRKDSRSASRPSSARSRRSSLSTCINMGTNSKGGNLAEPRNLQAWHHVKMKGSFFLEDDSAIVSLQYRLHIPQTTNVYLTIQPINLSQTKEKPSSSMSVDTSLFIVSGNHVKEDDNFVCFTELRDKEKFGWTGELSAGTYYLLPFSTGCRLVKSQKVVSKPMQLVHRMDSGELGLTREFRVALSDIFEVVDLDGNGLLSLEEYNFFEQRTSGEKCDEDAWAICKENFDTKKNELTREGFMELNLMEANDREGDPRDLWITMEAMGFNRALEMVEACPFVIDVYCEDVKPILQAVNLESGPRMLNAALLRTITSKAEARNLKNHDSVTVYTYRGESRISSVIANKSNQKVTVHVNNEQSKNCKSSRGMCVFAVEVPARTKMVCQHVMPVNEKQEWVYSCVESVLP